MHRVFTIVSEVGDKESERTHVKEALMMNGYPDCLINSIQPTDLHIHDPPIPDLTSNNTANPSGENSTIGAIVAFVKHPKKNFPKSEESPSKSEELSRITMCQLISSPLTP